jgi:uncharacterized damage-inducible protein DinB
MTPEQAIAVRDYFVGYYKSESATTRKVIAAAPADQNAYAPSERCMNAGKLMRHITESEVFFLRGIASGEFSRDGLMPPEVETPAAILAWYDENQPTQLARVSAMTGDELVRSVDFFGRMQWPACQFLGMALLHAVHHRGQLTSYLRPMGSKVPAIYGRSADDDGSM